MLVRTGTRLSQFRLRKGDVRLSDAELHALHERERVVTSAEPSIQDGVAVSVDLAGFGGDNLIGYRAKRHTGLVDVDKPGSCRAADFWEPLYADTGRTLILDPGQFYILASKEAVHVPPDYAAEMVPFDPLVGEFRVHYAGFFDPGFGHAAAGGDGARAVLEVRSRDVPFILEDGQIVGRLVYERMAERPKVLYGVRRRIELPGAGPQALQALPLTPLPAPLRGPKPLLIELRGCSSEVERQLPKLNVVGSIPIARSKTFFAEQGFPRSAAPWARRSSGATRRD